MSNFVCDQCGAYCWDTDRGYITGCEHYRPDVRPTEEEAELIGDLQEQGAWKIVLVLLALLLSGCVVTTEQLAELKAMDGCAVVADQPQRIAVYSGQAATVAAQRRGQMTIQPER